jgi:uncharacterized protein (DUF433 family)
MSGSPLTTFNNMLVRFFEELRDTFPEEKDIRVALDYIQNARKINPRLILDLFTEHVTKPLRETIAKEDVEAIIIYARQKATGQYNEIMPALSIFDRHWGGLADSNRAAIWKYMKVLVVLGDKAQTTRV